MSSVTQRGAILGLECDSNGVVFAYYDKETSQLWYDFLTGDGRFVARRTFPGPPAENYPGFLGSWKGSRLLTFRTKPIPQAILYDVSFIKDLAPPR